MDDPASDRLATPDVRLSVKGDEGEPLMPNAKGDLTCRNNTRSGFKDVVMLQGHDFEVYLSESCTAELGVAARHPTHVPCLHQK